MVWRTVSSTRSAERADSHGAMVRPCPAPQRTIDEACSSVRRLHCATSALPLRYRGSPTGGRRAEAARRRIVSFSERLDEYESSLPERTGDHHERAGDT